MNRKHLGNDFDDFLREGILEEVEAVATKRILAAQIAHPLAEQGISKPKMAQRMRTSRATLERLPSPTKPSVTLQTLDRAARAPGRHLQITLN
jgi:antitoxin HicB